jgi:hypothetical protein
MPGITIINNIPPQDVEQIVVDLKNKKFTVEVIKQTNGNYTIKSAEPKKMHIKLSV